MSNQVRQFADAAEEFCSWAEANPEDQRNQVLTALQHLSNLYRLALALPELFGEQDSRDISHEEWQQVFVRFGSLPFNYYSQSVPQEVAGESSLADLADDLADIWRDLKSGLLLFQSGYAEAACWKWRGSFWSHWGEHASGALYALHSWHSRQEGAAIP